MYLSGWTEMEPGNLREFPSVFQAAMSEAAAVLSRLSGTVCREEPGVCIVSGGNESSEAPKIS